MSYVYRQVICLRVIDGDTVELEIDMGNRIKWRNNFRLYGIDTPERNTPDYLSAKRYLEDLLMNRLSYVETHKPDKFGRWLVDLYIPAVKSGDLHINQLMIVEGHAKEYYGGKKV